MFEQFFFPFGLEICTHSPIPMYSKAAPLVLEKCTFKSSILKSMHSCYIIISPTRMLVTLLTLKAAMVTLQTFRYSSTPYWHKDNPRHKSLKQKPFVLNFQQISYIHSSHLYSHSNVPLSFPNVEPHVFWCTEMTAIPKSTLGKGEITQLFQDLWRVL